MFMTRASKSTVRAILAIAASLAAAATQASSYSGSSFTDITFSYSGFTTFNGAPSDGQAHTYFGGGSSYVTGIAGVGATMSMFGLLSYSLVLDGQVGNYCSAAQLWFGIGIGPDTKEVISPVYSCPPPGDVLAISAVNEIYGESTGLDPGYMSTSFWDKSWLLVNDAPIPEASTYGLMLSGLGALAFGARRRKSETR